MTTAPPWVSLLAAVLRESPKLEDRACSVDTAELFDEADDPGTVEAALALCLTCPALDKCQSWYESLPPSKRPEGICAGRVNKPKHRPRKDIA